MANGVNGGVCLLYKGTDYATKTDLQGQGNAQLSYTGAPIPISNKSSGDYRVNLDNATSEKAVDIAIDFTVMPDDTAQEQLLSDAFNGVQGEYIFDFGGVYYISGKFTPAISTETANKNEAVIASLTFQSSGAYTRTKVTP